MKKLTPFIFTTAFLLGCVVLWMILSLYESAYQSIFHHPNQVPYTAVLIKCRLAILLMPLPFILYCILFTFRKSLSPEGVAFYFGILGVVFMILLLLVAAAVLLPMVAYQNFPS